MVVHPADSNPLSGRHPNVVSGVVLAVEKVDDLGKLTLGDLPSAVDEQDHYGEGNLAYPAGWIRLLLPSATASPLLPIERDEMDGGSGDDAVYVEWEFSLPLLEGTPFWLYDDDWFPLPRVPSSQEILEPLVYSFPYQLPVETLMAALEQAYVTLDVRNEAQDFVPFQAHVAKGDMVAAWVGRDFGAPSEYYWWAHATAAFQGWPEKDQDPRGGARQLGLTEPHAGSLIFLECCREKADWEPLNGQKKLSFTRAVEVNLAHEIGHQFDLAHQDGKIGGTCYLMAGEDEMGNLSWRHVLYFSPVNIARIRAHVREMPAF
jgi:hypothetical protein